MKDIDQQNIFNIIFHFILKMTQCGEIEYITYHISDMIPVALPQHRAGAGLTRSLFPVPRTQIVQ